MRSRFKTYLKFPDAPIRLVSILLTCFLLLQACVTPAPPPLLNSERIEQQFGSYGVEVLCADRSFRVSNLYSLQGSVHLTRTFALVKFLDPDASRWASEHQTIVAGSSIGKTLKDAGWTITKHSHQIGNLDPDLPAPILAQYMNLTDTTPLVFNEYILAVSRDSGPVDYAKITEIYHPDYLDLQSLNSQLDASESSPQNLLGTTNSGNQLLACLEK